MPVSSVKTEQWAVIDSKNKVRVLLEEQGKAQGLCDRFHRIGLDNGPFRIACVCVVEMAPPPDGLDAPRRKRDREGD